MSHSERKPLVQPPQFPAVYPPHVLSRLGMPQTGQFEFGPYDQSVQCKSEPASSPAYHDAGHIPDCGYQLSLPDYSLTNSEPHYHQQWPQTTVNPPVTGSENNGQYVFTPQTPWV